MSLPKMCQNPTLRLVMVGNVRCVAEKLRGEQFYALHKDGSKLGFAFKKGRYWCAEAPGRNHNPATDKYASRQRAFAALLEEKCRVDSGKATVCT